MNGVWFARAAVVLGLVAASSGCCKSKEAEDKSSSTGRGGGADPKTAALLSSLGQAIGCPSTTAGHRDFCIATDGWASGTAGELPSGNAVFAGLTVVVEEGKTPEPTRDIKPSLFVMRGSGSSRFGKIFTPTPDSPEESIALGEFIFNVSTVFKGKANQAAIPGALYDFAMGEAGKASYALTKASTGWKLASKSPAEIRRVGHYWVAIEQDANAIHVNVLTAKLVRKL